MRISVFGSGYVGLVTGSCFAEMGNDVICADIDATKIEKLKQGISPIYEPGLDEMIKSNYEAGRLSFTTDMEKAVKESELLFIAVGTPPGEDGSADLKYVLQVATTIGTYMDSYRVVVTKSTVPVGTSIKVKEALTQALKKRGVTFEVDVVSNPEFLKEGTAIEDCLRPSRVVIGSESEKAREMLGHLYEPFVRNGNPIYFMDPISSEMTKYAANAMLATKISFMNELSRLCEKVGADVEKIRQGIGSDPRIGFQFIYAGVGYGGSCFPKDVRALIKTAEQEGEDFRILKSVEMANQVQRERYFGKVSKHFDGNLSGKTFAVWGVAFKPGTDDIREAPAIDLIDYLLNAGAKVVAYDPVAMDCAKAHFRGRDGLEFVSIPYNALEKADALCIVTEWKPFREPDFDKMKRLMKSPVIFDGRNLYDPELMTKMGYHYYGIGRGK